MKWKLVGERNGELAEAVVAHLAVELVAALDERESHPRARPCESEAQLRVVAKRLAAHARAVPKRVAVEGHVARDVGPVESRPHIPAELRRAAVTVARRSERDVRDRNITREVAPIAHDRARVRVREHVAQGPAASWGDIERLAAQPTR